MKNTMKKAMKRVLGIMLALVLAAGILPMADAGTAKAAAPTALKAGKKATAKLDSTTKSGSFQFKVAKASKVKIEVYTDLSSGIDVFVKQDAAGYPDVERKVVENGKTLTMVCLVPGGSYLVNYNSKNSSESGKVTVKYTASGLDVDNDKEPNDTNPQAIDFKNLKSGNFNGSILFGEQQDIYKVTVEDLDKNGQGKVDFSVKILTDGNNKISVRWGTLDATGDFIESNKKEISKSNGLPDKCSFSEFVGTETHYIIISSNTPVEYNLNIPSLPVPAEKITLKSSKLTMKKGKTANLIKSMTPSGANSGYTYSFSDNKKVKLLNKKTGKIKALKVGTVKVTIKYANGKKAVCTVTIK